MTFKQLLLPLPLKGKEISFIESPSNWEALAWIMRWPEWPLKHIAVHGEAGCGKTHLAKIFQEKIGAYWVQKEDLQQTPDSILQKASTFIIDNYDEIKNETWLFHFYNLTKEYQADVLYCGRHSPGQSLFTLPDLRSRIRSIHAITISQPEEELLQKIMQQRFRNAGVWLPRDFLDISHYVLNRIERSYTALDKFIAITDEKMLQEQRPFSISLVRDILTNFV